MTVSPSSAYYLSLLKMSYTLRNGYFLLRMVVIKLPNISNSSTTELMVELYFSAPLKLSMSICLPLSKESEQ